LIIIFSCHKMQLDPELSCWVRQKYSEMLKSFG